MTIGEDLGLTDTGSSGCGCTPTTDLPELDARVIPHAVRHGAIKGALSQLAPGGGMVLVAPHDPVPLLHQIDEEHPDTYAVDYLDRGPEAWRLRFVRR